MINWGLVVGGEGLSDGARGIHMRAWTPAHYMERMTARALDCGVRGGGARDGRGGRGGRGGQPHFEPISWSGCIGRSRFFGKGTGNAPLQSCSILSAKRRKSRPGADGLLKPGSQRADGIHVTAGGTLELDDGPAYLQAPIVNDGAFTLNASLDSFRRIRI